MWYRSLIRSVEPATEPVTVSEAKLHLKIEADITEDDTWIGERITAARRLLESIQDRTLVTTTWQARADRFPGDRSFSLPRGPILISDPAVVITYTDVDGASQTFSSGKYTVDPYQHPGRIGLKEGQSWPATDSEINVVTVQWKGGYGAAAAVPQEYRSAILMMVARFYELRGGLVPGGTRELDVALEMLMNFDREYSFGG